MLKVGTYETLRMPAACLQTRINLVSMLSAKYVHVNGREHTNGPSVGEGGV